MTQQAFDLLLTRLAPDREQAGRKYEQIRKALLSYFEQHGSLSPDEQVDDTFNRVARSLMEGKEIYIDNPAGYFYGVARNVLRQCRNEKASRFLPFDDAAHTLVDRQEPRELFKPEDEQERADHERRIDCLEKCLVALPEKNRELIVQYYDGETNVKIKNRKSLAERLSISTNHLRVRALRIREKLEVCVEQCLGQNQADVTK